jgi:alanine racemase
MNRAGVPWRELATLADVLGNAPPQGVFTHFHSAELNDGSRDEQQRRFVEALSELPSRPELVHAENSPAIARHRRDGPRWSLARPGIFLYGVGSGGDAAISPEPVASVRARVVDVRSIETGESVSYDATFRADRPTRIATLAIGYADGYRRLFSNIGTVILRGRRARVVGLVTMDMTMIDVTGMPCEIGDVATIVGRDEEESLDVATVAASGGISPYELLTGFGSRLPRRYLGR